MNRPSPTLPSWVVIAIVLVLSLAQVGCGPNNGPGDEPDTAEPDVITTADADDTGLDTDAEELDSGQDVGSDTDADDTSDTATAPDVDDDTGDDTGASGDVGPDTFFDPDVDESDSAPDPTDDLRVTFIDPSRGSTDGGERVMVIGAGFTPVAEVIINGVYADNVDVVDAFTIFADTPANPAGTYAVKVVLPGGEASLEGGFTYDAPLDVSSVDPARGPERGGIPVTVHGSGFQADTVVSFGGRLGFDRVVVSPTQIDLVAPPGVGLADVRVTGPSASAVLDGGFAYYTEVAISAVVPGYGAAAGGDVVRLVGEGLDVDVDVSFGPSAASVVGRGDGWIDVETPAATPGAVDVLVASDDRGADRVADGYLYLAAGETPTVQGVVPGRGATTGGQLVDIVGAELSAVTTVWFGDVEATLVEATPTALRVETPAHGPGEVRVIAESASGEARFTYVPALAVDGVDPGAGPVAGGTEVLISGSGFSASSVVSFGPWRATEVEVVDAGTLRVVTPSGAAGSVDVEVTDGGQRAVGAGAFTYQAPLAVVGFSPSRGSVAGNTVVTVRGSGFTGATRVTFGDVEAPVMTILDDATLQVRTPAQTEVGRYVVGVDRGDEGADASSKFLYYDPTDDGGGWWGDGILGAVNVTVLETPGGGPVEEALVTLSIRADDLEYVGVTDSEGRVTISGPDLSGEQTVHVSGPRHAAVTVNSVDAENITVYLSAVVCACFEPGDVGESDQCRADESCIGYNMTNNCLSPDPCESAADCTRPGMVCMQRPGENLCVTKCWCGCAWDGECYAGQRCIEELGLCAPEDEVTCTEDADCEGTGLVCEGIGVLPVGLCTENCRPPEMPRLPTGILTGELTGIEKVDDPGAHERLMGLVLTTTEGPGAENPEPGVGGVVEGSNGEYEIVSRIGSLAVIGLCGVYNELEGTFTPRWMAVSRYHNIGDGETHEVDLDCDIPLESWISFKLVDAPRGPSGPHINRVSPHLDFGPEGSFTFLGWTDEGELAPANGWTVEGYADVLRATGLPALDGPLADVTYYVEGGAYPYDDGIPFSTALARGVVAMQTLVTLPTLIPPAELTVPGDQEVALGGRFEWELDTESTPDFYYAYIYDPLDMNLTRYWEVWLPGDERAFNLPEFPEGYRHGPLPQGAPMVIIIFSIDAFVFDYDHFGYNDLGSANWEAYSVSGYVFFTE